MARRQPIELFMPPNMLKAKAGGGLGGIDIAATKRAEIALETLKPEFAQWLATDVKSLLAARARYTREPGEAGRAALQRAAHDIKGQAPTFECPLAARVATSLSRLIDELPAGSALPAALVDAHVDAIQAIHRRNLQSTDDRIAQALCAELDAQVDAVLAAVKTTSNPSRRPAGSADRD